MLSQNVTAVNDGPLNTVPGAQTINEDGSFTLSTGNGNAISVADVDAATLTVTLTVAHGTLTLASTAGLSFGAGDGTADATMTFTGTAAAINAALGAGLTYNPTANYNGPDSIAVLTTDSGQTGTGGPLQDNDSIGITINSVNDAPSGGDNTLTGSEDDPVVFTAADFGFTDANDSPANTLLGVKIIDPAGERHPVPRQRRPAARQSAGRRRSSAMTISVAEINAGHFYFLGALDGYGVALCQLHLPGAGRWRHRQWRGRPRCQRQHDDHQSDAGQSGAGGGPERRPGPGSTIRQPSSRTGRRWRSAAVSPSPTRIGFRSGDPITSATVTLTDRVAGDSLTLTGALPPGFTAVTTTNAGSIVIQISGHGDGGRSIRR